METETAISPDKIILPEKKAVQYFFSTTMIEQNSNLPPQFSEKPNKKHINYGETNDYCDYLVELFNRSSTHNAIIKGKHRYILGEGFCPDAELPEAQIKIAQEFIDSVNQYGQSLMDVMSPAVLDWLISGNLVLKGKCGVLTGKPEHLYHKDWSLYRCSVDDTVFYESQYWVFEKNGQKRTTLVLPREYKTIKRFQYNQTKGEGLIYYRDPRPQLKYYGLPEYIGSIQDIETEIEISEFHNNNVKSGFSAGFIIEFLNGEPDEDEKQKVIHEIKEKFTQARNAGELFVTFSDSEARGVKVHSIRPNDMDKQFEVLRKDVSQSIITNANLTSPMLMAIKTEGQLGGNNEIATAAELFQNTYVTPKQKVLERIVNRWFEAKYGFKAGIYIEKLKPVSETLALSAVLDVMTDDEKRDKAGLPPMTKEQKAELDKKKAEEKKAVEQKFSAEEQDLLQFLKDNAIDLDGEVVIERECHCEEDFSDEKINLFEKAAMMFKGLYDLPTYESMVYEFLQNNKGTFSIAQIAKELRISEQQVQNSLTYLQEQNYINFKMKGGGLISNFLVNPVSDVSIKEGVPAYRLVTRWKYDGPNDGRLRDWCWRMMNDPDLKGKLWKREDIDKLSIQYGRNVWLTRGGWYTMPNGNHRPSCRHMWKQVIVKIKA